MMDCLVSTTTYQNLAREVDLNEMIYAKGARFNGDKQCLNGTREEVLEEIEQWINSTQDVPPVYMLCGSAGTGKSAIANTVARRFNALKRLGSSFCFNRHLQKERGPEHLFPTIARDLSGLHSGISQALWEIIRYDKSLRTTHDIEEQFENFILKPLCSINISGPILIVIDALDESGYPRARRAMLSILARRVSELPANFRLLLTSRPEDDIECFFKDNSLILMKRMDSIAASVTERDILVYVRAQLSNNQGRLSEGIEDVHCRILAQKSESLFQWASVACGIIRGDTGKAGYTIDERFELIVASSTASHRRQTPLLDDLYSAALAQILNKDDADALSRFKSVMGQILAAYEPLSIDTLNGLRQGIDSSSHVGVITSILRYMGSLLSGVSSVDHSLPIRPLHTTFRDFLTDPSRSGDFYIDLSLSHTDLALASLRVMNKKLKVNICRLETSYQRNADVLDLEDRITEYIPPYLSYSCRFWADHLRDSPFQPQLLHEVKDFLYDRLLCWFEVLSLISAISIAWQKLSYLVEWSSKVGFSRVLLRILLTSLLHRYMSSPRILFFLPAKPKISPAALEILFHNRLPTSIYLLSHSSRGCPFCITTSPVDFPESQVFLADTSMTGRQLKISSGDIPPLFGPSHFHQIAGSSCQAQMTLRSGYGTQRLAC